MLCIFETMPLPGVSLATMISDWCGFPVLPKDPFPKTICQSCALDAQTAYGMDSVQVIEQDEMVVSEMNYEEEGSNDSDVELIEPVDGSQEMETIDLTIDSPGDNVENMCPNSNSNGNGNVSQSSAQKDTKKKMLKKTHKCNICGKYFMLPAHLKCHMWVHAREKPYKCLQCSQSYAQIRGLRRHERVHSSRPELRSYKCSRCPKIFNRNSALKNHETMHHN